MLAASDTVCRAFSRKYGCTRSVIRHKVHDGRLALITTASVLAGPLSITGYVLGTDFSIRAWASPGAPVNFTSRTAYMEPSPSSPRKIVSRWQNKNAGGAKGNGW